MPFLGLVSWWESLAPKPEDKLELQESYKEWFPFGRAIALPEFPVTRRWGVGSPLSWTKDPQVRCDESKGKGSPYARAQSGTNCSGQGGLEVMVRESSLLLNTALRPLLSLSCSHHHSLVWEVLLLRERT